MTYSQWIAFAVAQLSQRLHDPFSQPKSDAYLLLQYVTQKSKSQILAFSDTRLEKKTQQELTALLTRRLGGEPMAYILGETDFWSLNLAVSKDTLIPRPDTEILVEQTLALAKERLRFSEFSELAILDLGTGTGAIALSLAKELQPLATQAGVNLRVVGVDCVAGAVALAKQNAQRNQLLQVEFLQSHWFDALSGQQFDFIVSNPPYIDPADPHLLQGDVRFEPLSALIAEQQGYGDLQQIIQTAPQHLKPHGWLLLEHGWQQGEKVREMLTAFSFQHIATVRDYGDNERVSLGCRGRR